MKIKIGMEWDGPAREPEWDRRLEEIAPRQDQKTWLKLVWVPGDQFEKGSPEHDALYRVERWMIYQMYPMRAMEDLIPDDDLRELILADLKGPNPRLRGRYDYVLHQYNPDPRCNVDRVQWALYRETGCYGRPLWVVQGSHGGNKRRWRHPESVASQLVDGPSQPPVPGDLPYAAPDWRTWRQLYQYRGMQDMISLLAAFRQNPEAFDDEDLVQMDPIKRAVHAWVEDQTDEATGWAGESGSAFQINNPPAGDRARLVGITEE